MKKSPEEYWKALDLIVPKHNDGHKPSLCTDDTPNGGGNFGCKRCDAIDGLEKRRITIWPRSVMTGSRIEWEDEKSLLGEDEVPISSKVAHARLFKVLDKIDEEKKGRKRKV